MNITVSELLVNFSVESNPFPNWTINPVNGLMQFTPSQSDVGVSSYKLVIVRNISNPALDYITAPVSFNISNTNDPPNITSYYPASLTPSMQENSSFVFNVSATDPDTPYGDYFNYSWRFNGVWQAFGQQWNYSANMCSAGTYNVTAFVNDSSNTNTTNSWTLTVTNLNRPPAFNVTILNKTWQEDTNLINNLTLDDYFYDLDHNECNGTNNDTLTYSATGNNSVRVFINSTSHQVSFYPSSNWNGIENINFTLNDGYATVNSNTITLNITPVEDPPNITAIPNQTLYVGTAFSLQLNATDIDNDTLTYYDNTTLFDINPATGLINFTPVLSQIGIHFINLTVSDSMLNASQIVVFNISNNTAPILNAIGDLNGTEAELFFYDVNATDADNDTLIFYTNSTFFIINSSTGIINFTPSPSDVGNHSIRISVNDSKGAMDYEVIIFYIANINSRPNLTFIANQTMRINKLFTLYITGQDPDGDSLVFYDNSTIFNITTINSTTGILNFSPSAGDIGFSAVNITVSDSILNYSQLVWFNITENHAPFFYPVSNQSLAVNTLFVLYINSSDQDNDELNFTSNSTTFNITNYNATTGLINVTPSNMGFYAVNISVSDGNLSVSQLVWFNITGNTAPNITSYYPNLTNPSVNENNSIEFNITAIDIDGAELSYNWTLNGISKSSSYSWIYNPNFTAAGIYNVTVVVSDGNLTDSHYWNLTVNNTNRPPNFGIILHTSGLDFNGGKNNRTNSTIQSGNITLAKINLTTYYGSGNFTSAVVVSPIDYFGNFSFGTISWLKSEPANTSIVISVRTSSDNSTWTNWSLYDNSSGQQINASGKYLQYLAQLSTNSTGITPVLEEVTINYKIPDFVGNEDSIYGSWIDLDDFFSDEDSDSMTYNVTPVNYLAISIDNSHRVSFTPSQDWYGTVNLVFTANDSRDASISNNITVTFLNIEEPSTSVPIVISGGGGGGSTTIKETKIINKTEFVTVELIVPQPISIISNATVVAPLLLKNNGNITLTGISLSAYVNSSDILLRLPDSWFSEIEAGGQRKSDLFITVRNVTGSYSILVQAQVSDPKLNDSAVLQINILDNFTSKINYVSDFITLHPECLELTEAIQQAKSALAESDTQRAELLLASALDGCKFLVSASGNNLENPSPVAEKTIGRILSNRELVYTSAFIITLTLLIGLYVWYNSRPEV